MKIMYLIDLLLSLFDDVENFVLESNNHTFSM